MLACVPAPGRHPRFPNRQERTILMDSTCIADCTVVEQAAKERLATFVAFFQNAPVAMLLLDGDRQIREMNRL